MTADSGKRATTASEASEPLNRFGMTDEWSMPIARLAAALRDSYEIHREIGFGGSARVYLATDKRTNRQVAMKVLRAEYSVALGEARFRREIEIDSGLRHPNILSLLEMGSAAGHLYFTMPYIKGETLRLRIARERHLALNDALSIARSVAAALDYAHARGVIHRDIKPANILLEDDTTLVADFGIARAMKVVSGEQITDSGIIVGTPEYMSPEQATGERKLDGRSDIYALGCVVYEMLAGEPPFTGPSAQAIVARHCHEKPRSIRTVRPSIPRGVESAVEQALAKVPADRFATATQFVEALEAGAEARTDIFGFIRLTRRSRIALLGVLGVAAVGVAALSIPIRGPVLDASRIVVFPLYQSAAARTPAGEEVAMFIGYALDGTRPLKWTDGWELLTPSQRTSGDRLETRAARDLARKAGAGFFIDGSILRRPDSVTVLLRLQSVAGDSTVRLVERSAPLASASVPQLGVAAVQALLPDLVAPGGRIDVTALMDRRPAAVANFLQGEREYRRMQFAAALPHYRAAIRDDSAFALAGLRGAYTAAWLSDAGAAAELVTMALRHSSALPPSQVDVARGLRAYLDGDADTATVLLRQALRNDPEAPATWTILGEVYSRLLPNEWAADSLARWALGRARTIDHDFAPALLLLEELALRDGDLQRAKMLRAELRSAGADTTHALARELMFRCVERGPGAVDWKEAVARNDEALLAVGKVLGGRAAHPRCANAAFRALLSSTDASVATRFGAFLGMQAQLVAIGRGAETPTLLAERGAAGLETRLRIPYLVGAAAGDGFQTQARAFADSAASLGYQRVSASTLWQLGYFEAHARNVERVRDIARALRVKADSSRTARDERLARSVAARLLIMQGDTLAALAILRTLKPRAPLLSLGWWAWESLGPERLLYAQLLYSRGRYEEARQAATYLDAAEPIGYPMYLRPSLELRVRAAEALGDARLAGAYRERLRRLDAS